MSLAAEEFARIREQQQRAEKIEATRTSLEDSLSSGKMALLQAGASFFLQPTKDPKSLVMALYQSAVVLKAWGKYMLFVEQHGWGDEKAPVAPTNNLANGPM